MQGFFSWSICLETFKSTADYFPGSKFLALEFFSPFPFVPILLKVPFPALYVSTCKSHQMYLFFLTLSNAIDAPPGKAFIKLGLQDFVTLNLVRPPWDSDGHSLKIHDYLICTPFHPWGNVLSFSLLCPSFHFSTTKPND